MYRLLWKAMPMIMLAPEHAAAAQVGVAYLLLLMILIRTDQAINTRE
jgi:hypothetical protein